MNTVFYLKKDGSTWVWHATDGGGLKLSEHPIEEPCEHCPAHLRRKYGKLTAEGLPNVRYPRHGSASRPS